MREPAFPQSLAALGGGIYSSDEKGCGGMELRDYFAAKALQGMFACGGHRDVAAEIQQSKQAFCLTPAQLAEATNEVVAKMAYEMADAMLNWRKVDR